MKKAITIIGIMVTTYAFATDNTREITTSQRYVETQLSNRQDTIPAKNGDKVVTPTSTKGEIGERDIKTTLGDETTNQNDTGITTVETVKAAVDAKQDKLKPHGGVNIVTYTGTNDDSNATGGHYGRGVVTSTPIYDENVNTYGNGLVRAETLNTAVQRGVSRALTRVPAGFLINNIGDVLPTTMYVQPSDTPTGYCYDNIEEDCPAGETCYKHPRSQENCSKTMWATFKNGDWGVTFNNETGISYPGDTCVGPKCYKEVHGISACSSERGSGAYAVMDPDSISSILQSDYEMYRESGSPRGTDKKYCHCKVTEPHAGTAFMVSPWVLYSTLKSAGDCALGCAFQCGANVHYNAPFRSAVFGGVNITQ